MIACLFVLYNPSNENIESMNSIGTFFDKCYIYDNSRMRMEFQFNHKNTEYFSDGINHGLPYVYNYILDKAYDDAIEWVAIFDQDSIISNIQAILNYLNCASESDAIICPYVQYYEACGHHLHSVDCVKWTINSGSFLNVKRIVENNIKYDEYYYLDRVDKDFCRQILEKKLKIIRVNDCVLKQTLGELYKGQIVHTPVRNYYMARNRLYYNNKFYDVPYRWMIDFIQTNMHILRILVSGKQIKDNFQMIMKGIKDYKNGHGGCL